MERFALYLVTNWYPFKGYKIIQTIRYYPSTTNSHNYSRRRTRREIMRQCLRVRLSWVLWTWCNLPVDELRIWWNQDWQFICIFYSNLLYSNIAVNYVSVKKKSFFSLRRKLGTPRDSLQSRFEILQNLLCANFFLYSFQLIPKFANEYNNVKYV